MLVIPNYLAARAILPENENTSLFSSTRVPCSVDNALSLTSPVYDLRVIFGNFRWFSELKLRGRRVTCCDLGPTQSRPTHSFALPVDMLNYQPMSNIYRTVLKSAQLQLPSIATYPYMPHRHDVSGLVEINSICVAAYTVHSLVLHELGVRIVSILLHNHSNHNLHGR